MEIIDFYYYDLGEMPNDKDKEITQKTFDYLRDNNMSDKEILALLPVLPNKLALSHEDLPDILWSDSLIKRDTFYFHNELHIMSPPPYWDIEKNKIVSMAFFLEIKIKYTVEDLIKYYYKYFPTELSLVDNKKDIGSINYLLNKYSKIDFIENVDIILYLIDEAVDQGFECLEIINLQKMEQATIERLRDKVMNARLDKKNVIIWR